MNVKIEGHKLTGSITPPPSKSLSHRAIICAALSKGVSVIKPILLSDDILATLDFIETIDATYEVNRDELTVHGNLHLAKQSFDAGESGSTLRFAIPILLTFDDTTTIHGRPSLLRRPLDVYRQLFHDQITIDDAVHLTGGIHRSTYEIDGSISSQFVSGLLFALSLVPGTHELTFINELESRPYVDLTVDVMNAFGIDIQKTDHGYTIEGGQTYRSTDYEVEADLSQAAFFLVANAIGNNIDVTHLPESSLQGDFKIIELLKSDSDTICVKDIPDLLPILSVYAATRSAPTTFIDIRRLRYKESNRIESTRSLLKAFNIDTKETENEMIVYPGVIKVVGDVESYNDHRIVMSAAILSTLVDTVTIKGADAVSKSYPNFFEEFRKLGGVVHESVRK